MILALLSQLDLGRRDRRQLERALALGPWAWPPPEAAELREAAAALASWREPRPGEALLVTVAEAGDKVWVLGEAGDFPPFGPEALDAWHAAVTALPRALPLLWTAVRAAAPAPSPPKCLGAMPPRVADPRPEVELDGPSFGLAFAFALASRILGVAVPAHVAALAAIDADGHVLPVDGLEEKVRALGVWAPAVDTLVVSAEQVERVAAAAREHLAGARVVGVSSVAEALEKVWADRLADRLVEAGHTPTERADLVDSLFTLVLRAAPGVVHWPPVMRAAGLALERWRDLTDDERWRLECVQAIAGRHANVLERLELPPERLDALPGPIRLRLLAHLVQHATDFGQPSPAEVETLATSHLVRGLGADVAHLRLLGALGRLQAVTGRPESALALQEEAAGGFLALLAAEEVSHPLAEWFRLAGALGDAAAFERADAFRERVDRLGGLGLDGNPFVDLARARALVALGRADEAVGPLRALAAGPHCAAHVRASATRWLLQGRPDEPIHWGDDPESRGLRALAELDRALAEGGDPAPAIAALRAWMSAPVRNLLAAAPSPAEAPAYLARFFPY